MYILLYILSRLTAVEQITAVFLYCVVPPVYNKKVSGLVAIETFVNNEA